MAKGLGRGLEGLFEDNAPLTDEADGKNLVFVKISDVEPSRDQPRKSFDRQTLEELASSIAGRGLLQPIIVRRADGDRYRIVSGERRWRAARIAGLTEVPVIIKDLSDKEALEIGLIENLQRENLNIVEEAKGYKALIDEFSLTQEQVAEKVGKSRPAIANAMRILALPEETLDLVLEGKLSSGHARALLPLAERAESKKKFSELVKMIIDKGLTVRDVENLAKKKRPLTRTKKEDPHEIYYRELSTSLSSDYGRKVKVVPAGKAKSKVKGTIVLEYYSDDDLNTLIDMLKKGEE